MMCIFFFEKCVCMFSKMAASRYKMTPDLGNVYFERDGVGTAGPRTALSLLGAFAKSDTPPSLRAWWLVGGSRAGCRARLRVFP